MGSTPAPTLRVPATLQLPEEEAIQFGVQQEPAAARSESNSSQASRRASPGAFGKALGWMGLGSARGAQSSAQNLPDAAAPRVSVQPLKLAAADAKYVTLQKLNERIDSKVGAGAKGPGGCWRPSRCTDWQRGEAQTRLGGRGRSHAVSFAWGTAWAVPARRPPLSRPHLSHADASLPSTAPPLASRPVQELGPTEKTRIIYSDVARGAEEPQHDFPSNRVITSKYNIVTFLPIFLFEMFSRVAYLYFLLQARRLRRPGWSGARHPGLVVQRGPAAGRWRHLGAPSLFAPCLSAVCARPPGAAPQPPVCRRTPRVSHPRLPSPPLTPSPQAGLSWWSVVSPFSGYGSTAALVFVLAVAAVKAIWEDVKRHHEDKSMNTATTHRVKSDGAAGWQGSRVVRQSAGAAAGAARHRVPA